MTPSNESDGHSMQRAVILFGPPGSGKGTQGSLIAEKLNFYYLETSKLLEERFRDAKKGDYVEAEGKRYSFLKEKELWASGVLNSPPFVTVIAQVAVKELHRAKKSLLLSGSPRTVYEAKVLTPLLRRLYGKENIRIVMLELKEKETIKRNSQRRICELMRHPILSTKETASLTICPLDGSKLVRREGLDDPENIRTRLQQYAERTFPMLEYFESQGFKVQKVDAGRSVAEVYESIMKAITA